ncbi:MAG: hypothetical protein KAK00_01275 [Nanoarchaeota archaeon]|nr:hypothetical protein [Nanoarchaeota archaeon]
MKRTKLKGSTIVYYSLLVVLIVLFIKNTSAIPVPAVEFYGRVTINDTDAIAGINITAYDADNTLCGYFIIVNGGYYGLLSCDGDDITTNEDEGAEDYDQIAFYVNSTRAVPFGNVSWEPGEYRFVNLSVKNYPPYFLHNFTTQYINESLSHIYDVNCSDLNVGDNLTYYDNTTRFDIDPTTGIIDWIPQNNDVGDYTILITCSDGVFNVTGILPFVAYDTNNPPVLANIGPQIAAGGIRYHYDVNATDPDNDTLTYSSNSTLFTINPATGIIDFMPQNSQAGTYTINISVSDGKLIDYELIPFTITESPAAPGRGGAAEGDTAGTAGSIPLTKKESMAACFENWKCSEWSTCSLDGWQTRKCIDINDCKTYKKKPKETRECEYVGTCSDKIKNCHGGSCEEGIDCGGPCLPCPFFPSCSDGIQNCHGGSCEEGIDCGGPCSACEAEEFIGIPIPQLAPLIKRFPWLLLLIVIILLISSIIGDRTYVKKISKKEFEEYRKKLKQYKRIRKKIYFTSGILSFIGLVLIFYMYQMSDKPIESILKFIWIPIISCIIVLASVYFIIRHFSYYEYRKRKKEELFFLEHKKRKHGLIKIEDELLISLETKLQFMILSIWKQGIFKEKEVLDSIKEIYNLLGDLKKERTEKNKPITTKEEIKTQLSHLQINPSLIDLSKNYPEFKEILAAIKELRGGEDEEGKIKRVERFLLGVVEISQDIHILSIVKSSHARVDSYNALVDIYEYYKNQLDNKAKSEDNLTKKENLFMRKTDEITNKPKIMQHIRGHMESIPMYNSSVELYDHYKKRQDMHNEMEKIKRERKIIS